MSFDLFGHLMRMRLSPLTDFGVGTLEDRILDALDEAPGGSLNDVEHGPAGYVSWLANALDESEKTIRNTLQKMETKRLVAVHRIYDNVGKHIRYSITAHQPTADYFDQKTERAWPVGRQYQRAFRANSKGEKQ